MYLGKYISKYIGCIFRIYLVKGWLMFESPVDRPRTGTETNSFRSLSCFLRHCCFLFSRVSVSLSQRLPKVVREFDKIRLLHKDGLGRLAPSFDVSPSIVRRDRSLQAGRQKAGEGKAELKVLSFAAIFVPKESKGLAISGKAPSFLPLFSLASFTPRLFRPSSTGDKPFENSSNKRTEGRATFFISIVSSRLRQRYDIGFAPTRINIPGRIHSLSTIELHYCLAKAQLCARVTADVINNSFSNFPLRCSSVKRSKKPRSIYYHESPGFRRIGIAEKFLDYYQLAKHDQRKIRMGFTKIHLQL